MSPEGKALMEAVSKGQLRLARVLIDGGAYINSKDENKQTPLMVACRNNVKWTESGEKMIKFILDRNADPNCTDYRGNTAIILACQNFTNANIIRMLLEHHAKSQLINHDGDTALTSAIRANNTDAVVTLLSYFRNNRISLRKDERKLLESKYGSHKLKDLVDKLKMQPNSELIEFSQADRLDYRDSSVFCNNSSQGLQSSDISIVTESTNFFSMSSEYWHNRNSAIITDTKSSQKLYGLSTEKCSEDLVNRPNSSALPQLQRKDHPEIYSNNFRSRHNSDVATDALHGKPHKLTFYNDQLPHSLPSEPLFLFDQGILQHSSSMNERNLFHYQNELSKHPLHPLESESRIKRRNTLPPLRSKALMVEERPYSDNINTDQISPTSKQKSYQKYKMRNVAFDNDESTVI
ncbi:uncharacterized protein TRIADDRAFT_52374 [Trichoplax adhaerens]|uniref:Uncharacterized protein n=1 Tax=Trichoplax adhaerens TaxID=10228 RepID=B3RI73_TRIAD|nr:hypothetical protein TRIADDRAFT_52374 [Trichoplax adhaerens]EDV29702.1 hypothetical protein TRIADDRAFT_52374 [Trichoplax adhaerens]|eukprot:XP_002108904.1 hypothetical protein TRIADDRAFT_52374 [Trichoplax adhaerens]